MISTIKRRKKSSHLFLIYLVFLWASSGLFSAIIASAYSIKLGWEPNGEPDLEGYMLYSRQGSPCPPYDHIDTYPEKDLTDPLNPSVRITDLEKDLAYYFFVTAYDTFGNESDFSNVVFVFNGQEATSQNEYWLTFFGCINLFLGL
jgi:hypothetical protein